jgi:hypothetical protein
MTRPANIEYAGGGSQITDDQLRVKLRNAPAWVLDDINQHRETRGLPPLFEKRVAAVQTKAPVKAPAKVPTRAKQTGPAVSATLVAPAAPGVSWPTSIVKRGVELPEFISPIAWANVYKELRNGKSVPITHGHGGKTITHTGSTRFRCLNHPVVGLLMEVDLVSGDPLIIPSTGVSIGFRHARYHEAIIDGRRCRVVTELELRHIALLKRDETPAYRLARVRRCLPGLAHPATIDCIIDVGRAIKAEWPSLLKKQ